MIKKTVAIVSALALALLVVPGVFADEPFERFSVPATSDEAIERLPENLQSGFLAMRAALVAMGEEDEAIVEIFNSYVALNFIRVNIIEAGLEEIPFPNHEEVTYAEFYAEFRARLLANAVHILPAIIVLGNPYGTDWDQWFEDIQDYL